MNRRGLWTLIVVVVLLAVGAGFIVGGDRSTSGAGDQVGQPVLAGLTDAVDDLVRIELRSRAATVTLERHGDEWQVAEKGGYPVDFESLVTLLDALSDATIVERKTARPANHARLGVADPDEPESQAVVVTLSAENEPERWTLVVGETAASGTGGSYVRLGEDPQVWLVSVAINVDEEPTTWIDTTITNVASEEVARVDVVRADGQTLTVRREDGEENLVVDDVPEGRELKYPTVANEVARSLSNIRMTDVRPTTGEPWSDAHQAMFQLTDGTTVSVQARKEGEDHWLRIDRPDTTLSLWDYKVASYTFEDFTQRIEDMLKPLPAEDEASEETQP